MACKNCKWAGDTVEMFSRLRGIKDLGEAVLQAAREGICSLPLSELTPDTILGWRTYYPDYRFKTRSVWHALGNNIQHNVHPDVTRRLQQENLHGGHLGRFRHGMNNLLGGGTRAEICKIFTKNFSHWSKEVLPRDFGTSLVLNYQDVPGRTIAFEFLGERDRLLRFMDNRKGSFLGIKEGGLAMLDLLGPYEDTVFAFSDPELGLQLQRWHLDEHPDPLKVLVYNEATMRSWHSLYADRVIFWEAVPSWRMFANARQLKKGLVSLQPRLTTNADKPSAYLIQTPPNIMLHTIEKNAKPWHEAFVAWITSPAMTGEEAIKAITNIGFNQPERALILSVCPRHAKSRLENYLSGENNFRQCTYKNRSVFEKNNEWYVSCKMRGEELITDAVPRIEEAINDTEKKKTYWHGHVLYSGHQLPFRQDADYVEKHTVKWLRELIAENGLGRPNIHPVWGQHIIPISRSFTTIQVRTGSSNLGLQNNGTIKFPKFTIEDGEIKEGDTLLLDPKAPAVNVMPPRERIAQDEAVNPVRAAWWALAAATVTNWMRHVRGDPIWPVAAVGSAGSVAHTAARLFAKAAGLRTFFLKDGTRTSIDALRKNFNDFNYPDYVEPRTSGLLYDYPVNSTDQIIVSTTIEEAAALMLGSPWLFVHAASLRQGEPPPFDDFLFYLVDLQNRDLELSSLDHNLAHAVLDDLCAWLTRRFGVPHDGLLSLSKAMLRSSPMAGDALVYLFCWFHRAGKMGIDHQLFDRLIKENHQLDSKKAVILVDDETNKVFLPRQALQGLLKKTRLPDPDLAAAAEDLAKRQLLMDNRSADEGWTVPKQYWDEKVSAWQIEYPA